MNKLHLNRLLKLANHLRYGKLIHKEFDFSTYNNASSFEGEKYNKNRCGTNGCAMGECPGLFYQWHFSNGVNDFVPVLKDIKKHLSMNETIRGSGPDVSGKVFFGVSYFEYRHLFLPNQQIINRYGGNRLNELSTKQKVSANIRDFVKLKCKKLKIPYTSLFNKRP